VARTEIKKGKVIKTAELRAGRHVVCNGQIYNFRGKLIFLGVMKVIMECGIELRIRGR
jgi:hypothetical protein